MQLNGTLWRRKSRLRGLLYPWFEFSWKVKVMALKLILLEYTNTRTLDSSPVSVTFTVSWAIFQLFYCQTSFGQIICVCAQMHDRLLMEHRNRQTRKQCTNYPDFFAISSYLWLHLFFFIVSKWIVSFFHTTIDKIIEQ